MQTSGLDFQQAPPLSVPFRFYLSAPLFLLAAAAVGLWYGPALFESRWTLPAMGAVHLVTLGFMTMVMVGSMMQILPVLAGAVVPMPRLVAGIVHPLLAIGTLALVTGLIRSHGALLQGGVVLLGAGLAVFFGMMVLTLTRVKNSNATIVAMWLAILSFGVMLLLGLALGAARAWGTGVPSGALPNLHPQWGLIGWTGLLVAGAAYPIVPMFQITPNYPALLTRSFAGIVFALLALFSLAQWPDDQGGRHWLELACAAGLAIAHIVFAAVTLDLQRRRRRRLPDVTLEFWRVGMVSMLLAALLWLSQKFPALAFEQAEVLLGILVIVGVALSVIIGMLLKIVPFLVWFHLQAMLGISRDLPNMKAMLPEKAQRRLLRLHLASLLLLAAAALYPAWFAYPASLCLAVEAALLMRDVASVTRVYLRLSARRPQPQPV